MAQNKDLYQRYIQEVFNEARFEVLEEVPFPSYVFHDAPPGTPQGPEAIRSVVTMFHRGFSDFEITIDDITAEDDKVCARATTRGKHTGEIFGLAPTGNSVARQGLTLVRIVDGRITESWVKNDVPGLMRQLSANPS